ncbi:MAG TPA: hypothetical protein VMR62_22545 [Bryobacteraceae bacterium]|jgi:hypothetical protein|nr:hypothetical protein [Bryobacteraceae bacterium]
MPLSAGTKLGPYEILAPIGAGGMGEVYRARDPRIGRDVAIKTKADIDNASIDVVSLADRRRKTLVTGGAFASAPLAARSYSFRSLDPEK